MIVHPVGPLIPWVCTFKAPDGLLYGLTLYATDPEQIEEDWPFVTVEGRLIEILDE